MHEGFFSPENLFFFLPFGVLSDLLVIFCSTVAPYHLLGLLYRTKSTVERRSMGFYNFSFLFGVYMELIGESMKHSKLRFFHYAENTPHSAWILLSALINDSVFQGYRILEIDIWNLTWINIEVLQIDLKKKKKRYRKKITFAVSHICYL